MFISEYVFPFQSLLDSSISIQISRVFLYSPIPHPHPGTHRAFKSAPTRARWPRSCRCRSPPARSRSHPTLPCRRDCPRATIKVTLSSSASLFPSTFFLYLHFLSPFFVCMVCSLFGCEQYTWPLPRTRACRCFASICRGRCNREAHAHQCSDDDWTAIYAA
jgi:hypothetical protein